MKHIFALLAVVAASGANAATLINSESDGALTGATVEDLNGETTGSFTSANVGDLTITALTGSLSFTPFGTGGNFGSDGQVLSTQNLSGSMRIDFGSAINAFGMIFDASNSIWDVRAFDADDNEVGAVEFPSGPPFMQQFFGLSSDDAFSYVTLTDRSRSDWVLIDNITFGSGSDVAPVPLPAALPMLLVGLGGTFMMRRRKKA